MVASEYGYTFDQFKQLTFRTLYALLEVMQVRGHNEYVKQAALQGIKLDAQKVKRKMKTEEVDDKSKQAMLKIHREAIKRKVAEKTRKRGR